MIIKKLFTFCQLFFLPNLTIFQCSKKWQKEKLAKFEQRFLQSDVSMYCRSNRNHRNIYIYSNLYIEFTHNGTETNFLHKYILHYHSATYKSKLVPAASMRARQAHAIPKWPPNWLRNPELLN